MNAHEEGADGQEAHRVAAWLTASQVVASSAQSAAEHSVCPGPVIVCLPAQISRVQVCAMSMAQAEQTPEQTDADGGGVFLVCMGF